MMRKRQPCDHCGADGGEVEDSAEPVATMLWCSPECEKAWHDARPGSRDGWIMVEDMTPEQHARLEADLFSMKNPN